MPPPPPPLFYGHYTGQPASVLTGGFCWCKVLLPAYPCWRQPVGWDWGEDAGVLINGVICTVCVPGLPATNEIANQMQTPMVKGQVPAGSARQVPPVCVCGGGAGATDRTARTEPAGSARWVPSVCVGHVCLTACLLVFYCACLLYTSPSPRDGLLSRMPSSA